jgi:hypothetical protein
MMRRAFIVGAIAVIAVLLLMFLNGFFMHGDPPPISE